MNGVALRLAFAQAAAGSSGGAYTPFFGAWLASRGLHPTEIGAIISIGMLLRVLFVPVSGLVADARNDRRAMMLVLYGITFASYTALNFVSGAVAIGMAAITAAVAGGAASPLLESVSVRLSERFGFDYGHVRLWCSTLFVAANFVSGLAVSAFGLVVIAPWLAVALAWNVIAIYLLPAPPAGRPKSDFGVKLRATLAEARELAASPVFLIFLAAASLDQGSHALYYGYGGLHWRQLGYSGALIGTIWPLGIFAEIALMSVSLRVFRMLGATRLLLFGAMGCMLRWTILSFDPPLPFVVFAQFLHGATFALAHLGAMYFILKAVPPRLAATAQSLYAVFSSGLVMGLATLASGPLYAAYGGRAYLLMAGMGVASSLFALWLGAAWDGERITAHLPGEEVHEGI